MSLLTVCILSYNRPKELGRCLDSLFPLPAECEVVVFDDKSPRRQEIRKVVETFSSRDVRVRLVNRTENLGYDANLRSAVVEVASDYAVLLSDDDFFEEGTLENLSAFLECNECACGFLRSRFSEELMARCGIGKVEYERDFLNNTFFTPDSVFSGSFLYIPILFSGLVFRVSRFREWNGVLESFNKSIYTQVAAFALLSSRNGAWFISGPGVVVGSDGENGFGVNPAGAQDAELADRRSALANIRYQRRLIAAVQQLGPVLGERLVTSFKREFTFRSIAGLWRARTTSGARTSFEYHREWMSLNFGGVVLMRAALFVAFIVPPKALAYVLERARRAAQLNWVFRLRFSLIIYRMLTCERRTCSRIVREVR